MRIPKTQAAAKSGVGMRKSFMLSPRGVEALAYLMCQPDAPRTEVELVENLIVKAFKRAQRPASKG